MANLVGPGIKFQTSSIYMKNYQSCNRQSKKKRQSEQPGWRFVFDRSPYRENISGIRKGTIASSTMKVMMAAGMLTSKISALIKKWLEVTAGSYCARAERGAVSASCVMLVIKCVFDE